MTYSENALRVAALVREQIAGPAKRKGDDMKTWSETMKTDHFEGFLVTDLERAFGLVKDPADWKAPIDAFLPDFPSGLIDQVIAGIRFYTATEPTVTPETVRSGTLRLKGFRITADGYRAGPAGDH